MVTTCFVEKRILRRRDPFHDRLEARVIAEMFEIRIVLDPVCYRYACFECSFQPVEGTVIFAQLSQITCGVVKDYRVVRREGD